MGNLVLNMRSKFGFLGLYNREIGISPFERFYLGGDGLSGYNNMDGRELIGMRGYANNSLTPGYPTTIGGTVYTRYTLELRYPISLNPSATIYGLGFVEAGNDWLKWSSFNPFNVYRSVGFGVRVFLPMFGLLGLDWGYGLDAVPGVPGANTRFFPHDNGAGGLHHERQFPVGHGHGAAGQHKPGGIRRGHALARLDFLLQLVAEFPDLLGKPDRVVVEADLVDEQGVPPGNGGRRHRPEPVEALQHRPPGIHQLDGLLEPGGGNRITGGH